MPATKYVKVEKQIGAHVLSFETGRLAKQAAGAVLATYGDNVVLVATVTGPARPGTDFFPLTCDYRERSAAAGKFPGGFIKREGRPTTRETLASRLIDRPIRPLFPEWFHDEVQIQAMVLASDRQIDPDVIALCAASAALGVSHMPFDGPLAAVRLALVDGQYIVFPQQDQLDESELDLVVAGNMDGVLMIEGFAAEMPEDKMAEAIVEAHRIIKEICELQLQFIAESGATKKEYTAPEANPFIERLVHGFSDALKTAKMTPGKQARAAAKDAVKAEAKAALINDPMADKATIAGLEAQFNAAFYAFEERIVRELILAGTRPDGRKPGDLRNLECHVDLIPRVHGSALFQRGETQALITVVLGTGRDEQKVDGLFEEYSKKFMLDYNFPPFSVGECKPIRGPGRREIGHGMLAERSVKPVLPDAEKFPYTVRVISDILESNGSSSMASVCGATLGLMAAGVPITNPVAGISIGLIKQNDAYTLLTDIQGEEDHYGDMDFKIAGSQVGITGIQLDLKIKGINEEIIRGTLKQAKDARMQILKAMLTAISRPRKEISMHAPRLERTQIPVDKIGMLIGPGGKNIRAIQEETGTVIEVDDTGVVVIASNTLEGSRAALRRV
ncbi:MAG TPA: polyribonucleotide nucleotidyltransferase, partial [Pirellulales bacterium]